MFIICSRNVDEESCWPIYDSADTQSRVSLSGGNSLFGSEGHDEEQLISDQGHVSVYPAIFHADAGAARIGQPPGSPFVSKSASELIRGLGEL